MVTTAEINDTYKPDNSELSGNIWINYLITYESKI